MATVAGGAAMRIVFGVEQALKDLLQRVAADYGLDYAEMEQRYFVLEDPAPVESIASSPPPPVHRTVVAKPTGLCTGKTTKGAPCKKKAMAGECFCSVHLKAAAGGAVAGGAAAEAKPKRKPAKKAEPVVAVAEDAMSEAEVLSPEVLSPEVPPPKPAKKKAAKKKTEPVVHDHPVGEGHDGCEGCEVHGEVEEREDVAGEYEVRGSVRTRMMEMLSRVAAMEDEVVEEDE